MSSPNPLSLFCALLLCLPLAVVFILNTAPTTPTTTSSSAAAGCGGGGGPVSIPAIPLLDARFDIRANHEARFLESRVPVDEPPPPPVIAGAKEDASRRPPPAPVSDDDAEDEELFRDSSASYPPPAPVSYDDAEDEALFRVASKVSPKPKRPKKLAFMFLTTAGLPFAPLWEAYFNNTPGGLYNIYVHADPTRLPGPRLTGVFSGRAIPSKPSRRHTPTLISAARRLLARALLHDPGNAMFALLSPSCVPLRSFNFTYRTLAASRRSFIEILKDEEGRYDRWAARGPDAMLPEVPLADFRIGSQFWALTRRHARLAVADTRLWSKFKHPCLHRRTCYPEEHYFPTLLGMRDPRGCVPCTLTHVDWHGRTDGHPRTYGAEEVGPELIRRLRGERPRYGDDGANGTGLLAARPRSDPFLFARKFDPGSSRALMGMAEDVLFED
ncbi:glycosyltransferase BC10 [Syzygium oleosum]|uniref:glycosyltransferase BC10 n=1 Tax=Syzygium oleosum TaxID=219896 RepID=UPI0011D23E95|nr:glycosyltransferase BC10 [Syzygium oleosum]